MESRRGGLEGWRGGGVERVIVLSVSFVFLSGGKTRLSSSPFPAASASASAVTLVCCLYSRVQKEKRKKEESCFGQTTVNRSEVRL